MRNTSNCTLRITKSTPKKPCCSSEKTDKEAALQTLRQRFPCVRPMPRRGGINARLAYDFFRFLKRPQHALEAIQKAGGDASKVHWPTVEKAAVMESITQHRQQPKDVLAAIVKYSPGMVEPAQQEQARAFISTLAGKEIAAPKVGKQHDAPSLG